MAKKKSNIHDVFVRDTFSDPERAVVFLEEFLPQPLKNALDLQSLKVVSESYINEELKEHFSDLVFEISTTGNEPINIALLFEHKSRPDKYVLVQVGRYLFAHWAKQISLKKALRPVIPLVYYQGRKAWKAPALIELFPKLEKPIAEFIPDFKHLFFRTQRPERAGYRPNSAPPSGICPHGAKESDEPHQIGGRHVEHLQAVPP